MIAPLDMSSLAAEIILLTVMEVKISAFGPFIITRRTSPHYVPHHHVGNVMRPTPVSKIKIC